MALTNKRLLKIKKDRFFNLSFFYAYLMLEKGDHDCTKKVLKNATNNKCKNVLHS